MGKWVWHVINMRKLPFTNTKSWIYLRKDKKVQFRKDQFHGYGPAHGRWARIGARLLVQFKANGRTLITFILEKDSKVKGTFKVIAPVVSKQLIMFYGLKATFDPNFGTPAARFLGIWKWCTTSSKQCGQIRFLAGGFIVTKPYGKKVWSRPVKGWTLSSTGVITVTVLKKVYKVTHNPLKRTFSGKGVVVKNPILVSTPKNPFYGTFLGKIIGTWKFGNAAGTKQLGFIKFTNRGQV